ncbi:glutathione S-transferase U20-like [Gigantopelta aegis]|uniref:glutathione S-transferase U20-like n=1 Tax=Gigantopelta aegis TaxID=1735272 RepID=UPI001B887658|nr:glutathione S-transferase U20-like [Gigantopelta aegis]XP_041366052.1 glutathione S-transferase U20-like [Gigantopelta aegis]
MTTEVVKLYGAWFCPFVQRAWIALLEKGVTFEYIEIDLYDKTEEFLSMNPRGLVPAITHKGKSVYESTVCIEYVDEAWPNDPALLPADPFERAQTRIWSDFVNKKIVPVFYSVLQNQDIGKQEEGKVSLMRHLETITKAMSTEGPYFCGNHFGMVDIMLFPFALRLLWILGHFREFVIPAEGVFERFHKWKEACDTRSSVVSTLVNKENLIAEYESYANNSAKTEVADAIRRGEVLP